MTGVGRLIAIGVMAWVGLAAAAPVDDARKLYNEGDAYYHAADYDRAIEAFRQAYALSKSPGLLFNLAQAHRLKGDCRQALTLYRNYLRALPAAANRDKVEARIVEMDKCVQDAEARQREQRPAEPATRPAEPSTRPAESTTRPPEPSTRPPEPPSGSTVEPPPAAVPAPASGTSSSSRPRVPLLAAGGVMLGAGLALVAGGAAFSAQAAQATQDLADRCTPRCVWDQDLAAIDERGASARIGQGVLYGLGAALAVGGAVLLGVAARPRARPSAMVGPGVVMAGVDGRF
jgi:tetratricopeptide (TPR) repeat protein